LSGCCHPDATRSPSNPPGSVAVVATLPLPRAAPPPPFQTDGLTYYLPAPLSRPGGPRPSAPIPVPDWTLPDIVVPDLPVPDLDALPVFSGPGDPSAPLGPGGGAAGGYGAPGIGTGPTGTVPGAVYRALTVDVAPIMLTHPALEYPALLRSAGVEGVVIVEVVIDSAGVPEPGSLRVVQASHQGFVAAATRAVLGARFRPGRARGKPVRVLIRQPIAFRLTR